MHKISVLFVCLGNICRSPLAEAALRKKVFDAGLQQSIHVDSAGTAAWHVGKAPDPRSCQLAQSIGCCDISHFKARQFIAQDFKQHQYILAMDRNNLHDLNKLRQNDASNYSGCLDLLLNQVPHWKNREVPDPYYGELNDFHQVLQLIECANQYLLYNIRQQYNL